MRQRDLEILLEKVPAHPAPSPALEQYRTPPIIAADVLMRALALGDVRGKRVLDLGCGTGMLALGAAALGAAEVTGVDVDGASLDVARNVAAELGFASEWVETDVTALEGAWDTVIQNPPFGAQVAHADRPFIAKAIEVAPVVYTFHLTETGEWVIQAAKRHGATLTHAWDYEFPIKAQFRFHEKAVKRVPVTVFRFAREPAESPAARRE